VIARGDIRWASLGEPTGSGPGYRRPVVDDAVATIDAFLADGRDVVVHCHHGASRTGPVLRAADASTRMGRTQGEVVCGRTLAAAQSVERVVYRAAGDLALTEDLRFEPTRGESCLNTR
jgi:hypothetical protein